MFQEGGLNDGMDGRDGFTGQEFTYMVGPIGEVDTLLTREVDAYLGMGVDLLDDG